MRIYDVKDLYAIVEGILTNESDTASDLKDYYIKSGLIRYAVQNALLAYLTNHFQFNQAERWTDYFKTWHFKIIEQDQPWAHPERGAQLVLKVV